ncbi:MAG: cysteine--tRNA ligase [Planctomycetes bacterium]|nr:cysteine--tRNA ligase [Planctomycetota bacterium]
MDHNLRVYNTLTKQKEPFKTVVPGKVSMYVCGPTVYKPSHLGHMVGPVIFDTVKRYLTYLGYDVKFVVNITDVDDKLIVEAPKQGLSVSELAERVTKDYVENLKKLNVTGIDEMPRATHYIPAIIEIIQGLIDKGYAYPAAGDVYFDVTKDDDYGKLCNRDPEQLEAGARIEVSDKKRSPGDFALWKSAKPGEPAWDSPWGKGRPGWHIECSAMSMKLLGKTLDIHGGGLDLQFPHHENELAQSESYNGCTFVNYWMHNGLMRIHSQATKIKDAPSGPLSPVGSGIGGEGQPQKMSKSLGNEIVVSEIFKRHQPETLRFFLLATHYRRPIDYSEERLEEVRRGLDSFYRFFERLERVAKRSFYAFPSPPRDDGGGEFAEFRKRFLEHMDDDFNTGGAVGVLYELLSALNRFADLKQLEAGKATGDDVKAFEQGVVYLKELSGLLGVFSSAPEKPKADHASQKLVVGLMQLLIDLRAEARKAKNFALGDQIRKRLGELGVTLEDRPGGTDWRKD